MLDEQTTPTGGNTSSVETVLQTLLRCKSTIIVVMAVLTAAALGFSLAQAPIYEASVKILVGQESTGNTSLAGDVSGLQELTPTVAEGAQTLPIAQTVVEKLNLPEQSTSEVLGNMSAESDPGTMFVLKYYESSNPKEAQLVANTIGEVLSQKISEVSLGANGITATVWAPATLPETPVCPDPVRNSIVALMLGGLLGVVLASLLARLPMYDAQFWSFYDTSGALASPFYHRLHIAQLEALELSYPEHAARFRDLRDTFQGQFAARLSVLRAVALKGYQKLRHPPEGL
jgi:capsular polysaccharide biosynthesis protein